MPTAIKRFPVLLITLDYKNLPGKSNLVHPSDADISSLLGDKDQNTMRETLARAGFLDGDIEFLANERADSFNMLNALSRVGSNPFPTTVFVQGHGMPGKASETIEFIPHDYYTSSPPRGITCEELCRHLSPRLRHPPVRRLIITDFCLAYNINALQYVLEISSNQSAQWAISKEWEVLEDKPSTNDIVVHFAAGSRDQLVYENDCGGLFTQTFCKVMNEPRPLPSLLHYFRKGVQCPDELCPARGSISQATSGIQVPQIYSSHKLDLEDPDVLRQFGWFSDRKS